MEVDEEYVAPAQAPISSDAPSSSSPAEIGTTVTTSLRGIPQSQPPLHPQASSTVSPMGMTMAMYNDHMGAILSSTQIHNPFPPEFHDSPYQVHSFLTDTHGVSHYHRPGGIHHSVARARWAQQMAVQRNLHVMQHRGMQAIRRASRQQLETQHRVLQQVARRLSSTRIPRIRSEEESVGEGVGSTLMAPLFDLHRRMYTSPNQLRDRQVQRLDQTWERQRRHQHEMQRLRQDYMNHEMDQQIEQQGDHQLQHQMQQLARRRQRAQRQNQTQGQEQSERHDQDQKIDQDQKKDKEQDQDQNPDQQDEQPQMEQQLQRQLQQMDEQQLQQLLRQHRQPHRLDQEQEAGRDERPTIEEINSGHTSRLDSDDEWESETEDALDQDMQEMIQRIQRQAMRRRRALGGGISKPSSSKRSQRHHTTASGSGKTRSQLSKAYKQFMKDGADMHELVSQMGGSDIETVRLMLDAGIPVDISDNMGRTPLHIACSHGRADTVRLLVSNGASVNATDRIGNTPLALAATSTGTDSVFALLEAGADPRIGSGTVSAMGMVRSRLKRMRAAIRDTRVVEDTLDAHILEQVLASARERRRQATAVARECVDIIRMLRAYTPQQLGLLESGNQAANEQEVQRQRPPKALTAEGALDLDDLTAQLQLLAVDKQPATAEEKQAESTEDEMPDIVGVAVHRVTENTCAQRIAQEKLEEDQMDALLDKFAMLLATAESQN